MRRKELRIAVHEYEALMELNEVDRELVLAARDAAGKAYSPYSGFRVGAAVLLENDEIVVGSNQENSAFTSGMCAERVALLYANSKFFNVPVKALAVTAENVNGLVSEPVKPCGACRQTLIEIEARFQVRIRIILDGKRKIQIFEGADNLLPFAFKPDSLG